MHGASCGFVRFSGDVKSGVELCVSVVSGETGTRALGQIEGAIFV